MSSCDAVDCGLHIVMIFRAKCVFLPLHFFECLSFAVQNDDCAEFDTRTAKLRRHQDVFEPP